MYKRTNVKKMISRVPSRLESMQIGIRCMTAADLDTICEIEMQTFDYPWDRFDFGEFVRKPGSGILVAIQDGQPVGYLVYEMGKNFVSIENLAVTYLHRRSGVGRTLIQALAQRMECCVDSINLTVRERNLDAQLFFRQMGFSAVAILRDFYEKTPDDAYIMQYNLTSNQPTRRARYAAANTASVNLAVKNF